MIGRWLSCCVGLCAIAVVLAGGPRDLAPPLAAQGATPDVVALRNGTIITAARGTIANGTVLVRNGKIAAVGTNVSIPAGADVYDVTGKFVSPGIIDAHSHIANDAINEGSVSVSSMTGMEDVLDPSDINIYRGLAGGTTAANILHGSANAIGGKTVVIKLKSGKTRASELMIPGRPARDQVRAGRERHAQARGGADQPAAVPGHASGRRIRHPRRVHTREGLSQGLAGLRGEEESGPGRARTAPRSAARRAGGGARKQAPGPCPQLPRRRDPDADPSRRRDGLQDHHLPARARGLQGGQGDRRAQRRCLHVLRLVGLQDGGGGRHSAQRLADDPQGRAGLDQLRRRRAAAAAQHGGGQGDSLRRRQRRSGLRHGDPQPREATEDRQPRRLDRSRQGRGSGRLEQPSAVDRRHRRTHLRRRRGVLRPRERPATHRGYPERKGRRPIDDRGGARWHQRRAGGAPGASGCTGAREVRRQGERQRTGVGDHQRPHRDCLWPGDPQGNDRHQGQPD